ncbi:MAG: diguanylate cyclase [Nitrospirae bacterium]|nr:diguanylate cyclase [Nitrospirota bacterium]MBF0593223.1 diguanylate cyclase [Nitrospirota bacterium]
MSRVRIIIVEDEAIIASDLKMSLEGFGYEVVAMTSSGEQAVELALGCRPDLMLMDIVLRGDMDGIETANTIRAFIDVPIIFLTSHYDQQVLNRAKIIEPFGYMLKPYREEDLYVAIDMAIYKHRLQKRLRQTEQWLSTTLNSIGDAVITTDGYGCVTFINPVALMLTGLSSDNCIGGLLNDLVWFVDEDNGQRAEDPFGRVIKEKEVVHLHNHTLNSKAGRVLPVSGSTAPIRDEHGKIIGVVLVFQDQSQSRKMEEELRLLSLTDELTGLNNRRGFLILSEQQIKLCKRLGTEMALLFIDLDGMKYINDTFGHKAGDCAILDTACVLRQTFRDSDILARMGGDEFVVLITEATGVSELSISERLNEGLALYNETTKRCFNLSFSVGIVHYTPSDVLSIDELLTIADRLMYKHKQSKR